MVDRAKGILMDRHGMAEAEAFRFVQKTAMDSLKVDSDSKDLTLKFESDDKKFIGLVNSDLFAAVSR